MFFLARGVPQKNDFRFGTSLRRVMRLACSKRLPNQARMRRTRLSIKVVLFLTLGTRYLQFCFWRRSKHSSAPGRNKMVTDPGISLKEWLDILTAFSLKSKNTWFYFLFWHGPKYRIAPDWSKTAYTSSHIGEGETTNKLLSCFRASGRRFHGFRLGKDQNIASHLTRGSCLQNLAKLQVRS